MRNIKCELLLEKQHGDVADDVGELRDVVYLHHTVVGNIPNKLVIYSLCLITPICARMTIVYSELASGLPPCCQNASAHAEIDTTTFNNNHLPSLSDHLWHH